MTWAEHHQCSEKLAAQAYIYRQSGQEETALALYAQAAAEEELALNALDSSRQRTLGITCVSAASLWHKAKKHQEAKQLADFMLRNANLPEFAVKDLRQLLENLALQQSQTSSCAPKYLIPKATIQKPQKISI